MTRLEIIFVIALAAKICMELFLELLNRSHVRRHANQLPTSLEGVMDLETYEKSTRYTLAKSKFSSFELLFDAVVLLVVILSGALPALHAWWVEWLGSSNWASALFLIFVMVLLGLPGLPLEYWSQFKLEDRFGFNRSTVGLWIVDKLKGMVLGLAIGFPLLWLLLSLVDWLGEYWWVYGFVILMVFQIVMMVLYPMLILPLFNKLSPLEDGTLRDRLLSMAERAGLKAESIQVIDGSKRSTHSNAYFTGFGRFRRIVLYDTLIDQLSEEELEAVLAHEIGHYKRGHIPKMIAISAAMLLAGFYIVDRLAFSDWFLMGFGFEERNLAIAMLLFSLLGGLFTFWFTPLFNILSRKHEYEADAFARDLVGGSVPLRGALRRLSEKNLSNLNPHPAYSGFHYSHPTLIERERAMRAGE